MKKRHRSRSGSRSSDRSGSYQVSRLEQKRFQGDGTTIFYNLAGVLFYAIFLRFSLNDTAGWIVFFVFALLQIVVCAILGINFNSKMWLLSALIIFLIVCVAFVYANM